MSGLITGFIEGLVSYEQDGSLKALPFQDKIENATFTYTTENLMSETFSAKGMKGASQSCPYREECSMQLSSTNLAWSFLQAATNTLARDAEINSRHTYSHVVATSEVSAGTATIEVDWTPATNTEILVADETGQYYTVTHDDGTSPATLTVDHPDSNTDVTAGQKLTISYVKTASGTNNEIALGSGDKLGEVGLYGRFFGCPNTLLIMIPRAIIQSNLEFAVGDDAANASLTATALRDKNGNFALIQQL